ncbi:MAG: DUF4350 domain-containing protein [Thermoplasmatota archaeon]
MNRWQRSREFARTHPRRIRAAAVVLGALLVAAALLVPLVVGSGDQHLSAYTSGAQDVSQFRDEIAGLGAPVEAVTGSPLALADVTEPQKTTLFLIGVEKSYTQDEQNALLDFVARGGALVIATDTGFANALANHFGVLFGDKTVLDQNAYRGDPKFVIATIAAPGGGASYNVLFNAPSYLTVSDPKVRTLGASSNQSFVDVNGDGTIDIGDHPGPFILAAETTYGENGGRVVFVADTAPFMNEIYGVAGFDDRAFTHALAASVVANDGLVLLDESRHVEPAAARAADAAVRFAELATATPAWSIGCLVIAAALAALAAVATRETQDWTTHVFSIGEEVPAPRDLAPTPERLTALARRLVAERYNIPAEAIPGMTSVELARLTGEPDLATLAIGKENEVRALNLSNVLRKLQEAT